MALVVWLMMKEMSFDGDYMVANDISFIINHTTNAIIKAFIAVSYTHLY